MTTRRAARRALIARVARSPRKSSDLMRFLMDGHRLDVVTASVLLDGLVRSRVLARWWSTYTLTVRYARWLAGRAG